MTEDANDASEIVKMEQTANGVIVRKPDGKFAPGTKPANIITAATARDMQRKFKEKTARLLREKISEATFGKGSQFAPAAAVAEVGSAIWKDVANNPQAHARDRLEAWQAIGKHAQMLGDPREKDTTSGISIDIGADLARDLVQALLEKRKKE